MFARSLALLAVLWFGSRAVAQPPGGSLALDFDPQATYAFSGVAGERIAANKTGWLLRAPQADPGLLAMFRLRDRQPLPQLVPWAGEFAGKYLISAIQALRMDSDPKLKATVAAVVQELIACQAADGYLGPFPESDRLLKNWDLWGHYHVMLALLMWHEQTGDATALEAACKAADLACRIYLDTERRPRDAGSTEMNLAIIHSLGRLYRLTRDEKYLRLMRVIEEDWQQEGDYVRTGLAGVEFYRTPKPRWESLPDLQGLLELLLITGDERYRTALLHHWNSIRRLDRRNTGGFSSGEQATGTPYEPTAIETCCTIAWMALTVDVLRMTGDPLAADELELSTFNGMLGAQHPSGSWWTYNTPMDGVREASHHTIVFQARAGAPDLNCCSANAPRGLGMLSEWALMRTRHGLAINYIGPLEAQLSLADGTPVVIRQETLYPLDGHVKIQIQVQEPHEFPVQLRIPSWSRQTQIRCLSQGEVVLSAATPSPEQRQSKSAAATTSAPSSVIQPGTYYTIDRRWLPGDTLEVAFDMTLRYESGGGQMAGKMSVYRGPILLAYDSLLNDENAPTPPPLTPADLAEAKISKPSRTAEGAAIGRFPPWMIVDIPRSQGPAVRLCDFASAGSCGSQYFSWLPAQHIAPPPLLPDEPAADAKVPAGRMLFTMRHSTLSPDGQLVRLLISATPDFQQSVLDIQLPVTPRIVLSAEQTRQLQPHVDYYWRLVGSNEWGETPSPAPPRRISIDPALPPLTDDLLTEYGEDAEGLIVAADLAGDPQPRYGKLLEAGGWKAAAGWGDQMNQAVELDGAQGLLRFQLKAFPQRDYTVSLWCRPLRVAGGLGQVLSAWSRGMDDPLRICVQDGNLSARIEAGAFWTTKGVPIQQETWYHICVVKRAGSLSLYLNGQPVDTIAVPHEVSSSARDFALGGNPHYTGASEHLACRVARLALWARAFSAEEAAQLAVWGDAPK